MKCLFPMVMLLSIFSERDSIYDIDIQLVASGQPVSMYSFANKKILIATISSDNPDTVQLRFLDSLQTTDTSLNVVAVPLIAGNDGGSDRLIANLQNSMALDFIITKSARVKKNEGINQHSLFRWLTNVTGNGHFDTDVGGPGQLFIISRSGILYSVLENNVPLHILTIVLKQELIK
jgi:glutathione peroxidase